MISRHHNLQISNNKVWIIGQLKFGIYLACDELRPSRNLVLEICLFLFKLLPDPQQLTCPPGLGITSTRRMGIIAV
mgnify:CR=1 FL=1